MGFWDGRSEADRLETLATGFEADEADQARPFYASPMGLLTAAVVLMLALLFFTVRSGFSLYDEGPWTPGDVIANQRLTDIQTERQLTEARASAWQDRPVIDAHVSTVQANSPVK